MAHAALKGKLVEGRQEVLISKEIFLKVNEILGGNRYGYSCHEEAEEIPLKRFLKCDHCGSFMRGYVVKAKIYPITNATLKVVVITKAQGRFMDSLNQSLSISVCLEMRQLKAL